MTEKFLHYLWKYKIFNFNDLKSVKGESLQILNSGIHNTESGPDFSNAKIQIDQIIWAGQVEIHLKSSDWFRHKHQLDKAYENTILHVVWEYDKVVLDQNNVRIPTLELKGRVSKSVLDKFHQFEISKHELVCQGLTDELDLFRTHTWLNRLVVNRLESKTIFISEVCKKQKGDWSQTFFILLGKNLGFKTNALPMQLVCESIDIKILLKHRNNLHIIESILFGVSGLINEINDDVYFTQLKDEFAYQKSKYGFTSLDSSIWKFGGVRPINFPTLRLAQLAQLIFKFGDLFHVLVRDFGKNSSTKFLNISASSFWNTHYSFSSGSKDYQKKIGDNSITNILINTVVPMQFLYGKSIGNSKYQNVALHLLDTLPAESNSVVTKWKNNNISAKNAADTQSLIELTNTFCKPKNCLNCGIGSQILNN